MGAQLRGSFMRPIRSAPGLALFAAAALTALGFSAGQAFAWGSTGHRLIGQLAVESLPLDMPAFLHTREASDAIGELAREPDRSRGSGQPHDADLDPGHFIDLTDDGKTLGGSPITAMPRDRDDYSATLRASGSTLNKGGYLYYNILDGFQQLAKDFAYYRIETAALKQWTDPQQKAWLVADLNLRERIVIRDLGWWAHFVGDASQPMHLSIHYNGWGAFPNPNNYTQDKIHVPFEGPFVAANLTKEGVRGALAPATICAGTIQDCVADYLQVTAGKVEPLYKLWGQSGFQPKEPKVVAFTTERVAAGAAALRDLAVMAWIASEDGSIGYPPLTVKAVEGGTPVPFAALYGDD
jgi:hypothetical protein